MTGTGETSGLQVSPSDSACARILPKNSDPDISLIKSVNGDDANVCPAIEVADGSALTYTFTVVNTGSETLENIKITDDVLGDISTLTSGASITLSHTNWKAPAAGLVNPLVLNIATDTGTGEKSH